jgi:hypothetical protein
MFYSIYYMYNMSIENNKKSHVKAYWGPRLWYLLHKITYNYPENPTTTEQQYYLNYFNIIQRIIPCPYCAAHFKLYMNLRPIRFSLHSRSTLIEWLRKLHNNINVENKKRLYSLLELDIMYGTIEFNHNLFHECIDYMFEVVLSNQLHRQIFLYWMIMTYNIHPCPECKINGMIFIQNNPFENINYMDNTILKAWIDGIKSVSQHV